MSRRNRPSPFPDRSRMSRRDVLQRCGMGLGGLALADLLHRAGLAAPDGGGARPATSPGARAKRVIHLFMAGGPSHVDTFDPKPVLNKRSGQELPGRDKFELGQAGTSSVLFGSPFSFARHGQCGMEISEVFPHLAKQADRLCVIRSMHCDIPGHEQATMLMHCGDNQLARPSLGAWVTYGLGSENENLPAYIALCPRKRTFLGGSPWQAAFLPPNLQATYVNSELTSPGELVPHVTSPHADHVQQRSQLDLLARLNRRHADERRDDPRLEARIQSFELASGMQVAASDAFDLSREPQHVLELYGEGIQARQLIMARRLVERGVRFVQVWFGPDFEWDHHASLADGLQDAARACDQPIAGLLTDLAQRGLLEETLVLWGGEFGRSPTAEINCLPLSRTSGRDHHHLGFSMWAAGGGVKSGHVHGATDEFGLVAVQDKVHVHDMHATILHLLGLDHTRLTYRYAGRDFRLTDVYGNVIPGILA